MSLTQPRGATFVALHASLPMNSSPLANQFFGFTADSMELAAVTDRFAENRCRLAAAAEPGMRKARDRFDALLDLIRAGTSVRRACLELELHREHVKRALRDPDRRARYDEAMAASIPLRKAALPDHLRKVWAGRRRQCAELRKSLEHLDAVLALVENGESLAAACRSNSQFPTKALVRDALNRDPALMVRYRSASKHHRVRPGRPTTAATIDAVIADVAGGTLLRDSCAAHGIKVPAFQFRVLNDPAQRPRWLAAKERAIEARLAHGTLRHAVEIIGIIESGRTLKDTLASDPRYPHSATFRKALDSNASLRARYDAAIAKQVLDRFVAIRRPRLFVPAPAVIKSKTMPPGEHLATSLSSDALWRVAVAALPKHLDPDMRNDVASDIIVAVLSGDLSPHQIASEAKRFLRAHNRQFSQFEFASLDKSVAFDSTLSIIETLSSDAWE